MTQVQFDAVMDARGLSCPLPLLKARQALMILEPGNTVCVLATDPASPRDFEEFAEISGHELVEVTEENEVIKLVVRKR